MTSTDHYLEAERLLEHASKMLDTDVAPEDRAELVTRQGAAPPPWPPLTHCSRLLHPPGSARTLTRWTPRHGAMRLPPPAGPSAATRSGCRRATASAMSPRRVQGRTTAPTRSPGSGTRRPGDRIRGAALSGQDHMRRASTRRSRGRAPRDGRTGIRWGRPTTRAAARSPSAH